MKPGHQPTTNELLGYPEDARLLIINVDDFGMCHAGNIASLQSLTEGTATSTTLMVPCPWAPHAMRLLKEYAEISFGVHLTLVCDFDDYRWGPVSAWNTVPTLVDDAGYLHSNSLLPGLLDRFDLDEVATEFRAQIETVLAAGLNPTHLDWHCIADGGKPEILELTVELARDYGLAIRIHDPATAQRFQEAGRSACHHGVLDSYRLDPAEKQTRYVQLLKELPAGLSEWAVHPSLGNDEARALEPQTWQVRRADLDFLTSPGARDVISQEGIVLLDYRSLQEQWNTLADNDR